MFARSTALIATALLSTGCMRHLDVAVLSPAEIDVSTDVQRVAIINRSTPKNFGQELLAGSEGAATGEWMLADKHASEIAIDGLLDVLAETGRYDVIQLRVDGKEVDTSLWDKQLDAKTIRKLCKKADCDAVISLDAFDGDTFQTVGLTEPTATDAYQAQQDTSILTTWRIYDSSGDTLHDEVRTTTATTATASGEARVDTAAALPGAQLIADTAYSAGKDYGARIAPHTTLRDRAWFGSGDPALRTASRHMKVGDLDGAMQLWRGLLSSPDTKTRAKARFNLALGNEMKGEIDRAISFATKAAVDLSRPAVRSYALELKHRQREGIRLAAQLAEPEAEAVAELDRAAAKSKASPNATVSKGSRSAR